MDARRRPYDTLLAVALLLAAGCSGLAGDPTPTVTPAPVPTDTPVRTPVPALAPGVTADGVEDPLALVEAHDSALRGTSRTVRLVRTIRYPNGTLVARRVQVTRIAADGERFHTIIDTGGPEVTSFRGRIEFWSDGSRLFQEITFDNRTSYAAMPLEAYERQSSIRITSPGGETFFLPVIAVETRVTGRVTRNGTTLYRLEGTAARPDLLASATDADEPHNATLRALVDARGVVHEFRLAYDGTLDGRPVRVVLTGRYTGVGTTIVDRPSWYRAALNATGMEPRRADPITGRDSLTAFGSRHRPGTSHLYAPSPNRR